MRDLVDLPLVDHHCHGVAREPLDRAAFEAQLCEASGPGRWHGSLFDSQVGFAVRRICAPLLDLPAHAGADDYLTRRAELGADEVNRRMIGSTGISDLLVDTGYLGETVTSPDDLGRLADATAHQIVRLETVAEFEVKPVRVDVVDHVLVVVLIHIIVTAQWLIDQDPVAVAD